MTKQPVTRRELARWAVSGTAAALLTAAFSSSAQAQVVDPLPAAPPPLPETPVDSKPMNEGDLLAQLVPINAGYALTSAQAKEVALQLKDYPGGFAKARAYVLPDETGPAFAADAPRRKERAK